MRTIPRKLYDRMCDMMSEYYLERTEKLELELVNFQDKIHWPFHASQEQLEDWNYRNWST